MTAAEPLIRIGCLDDGDIQLDEAALELAAADRIRPDVARASRLVDQLAIELRGDASGAMARAEALVLLLARTHGFSGDRQDYDNPANADFMSLLERRRALPITLAILYVAVARRHGWVAQPLALPGHMLVAIGGPTERIWIDAFAEGRILHELHHPNEGTARQATLLDNRETLVRLVMNQVARADKSGGRRRILYERLTAIAPGEPALWWERARLERDAGDRAAARRSLAAMSETTHNPRVAGQIRAALKTLAG